MPVVISDALKDAWQALEDSVRADGYIQAGDSLGMLVVVDGGNNTELLAQIASLTAERDTALAKVRELEAIVANGIPTADYAAAARQTIAEIDEVPRPEKPAALKKKRS